MVKNKKVEYLIVFLAMPILLFFLYHIGIKETMTIHIASDEFGYWTGAANILGYDWSNSASSNGYYSFGYGIVLAPLLLIKNSINSYKIAIYINILFIIFSYFITIFWERRIEVGKTLVEQAIISFIVNCYAGLFFYTKLTLAECLLWMLFALCVSMVVEYEKKEEKVYFFGSFIIGFIMMYVHMRAIGIIVSLLITYFIYFGMIHKKDLKFFSQIVILLALGFILFKYFKNDLKNNQYILLTTNFNEISGQTHKIVELLQKEGIVRFILNCIGRIWYLGISSIMIIYVGLEECLCSIKKLYKERNCRIIFPVFILGAFGLAIMISALYMIDIQNGRRDYLFYGRYSEYIIAPLLLLGIKRLFSGNQSLKRIVIYIMIQIIIGIIVVKTIIKYKMQDCLDASIPAIYYWLNKTDYNNDTYIFLTMLFIVVFIGLFILCSKEKCRIISSILICSCWLYMGYNSYKISDTHKHDEDYYAVFDAIEQHSKDNNMEILYYFDENDVSNHYYYIGIDRIQFMLKDKKIEFLQAETEEIKKNSIVITRGKSQCNSLLRDKCEIILENREFNVYEYK